MEGKNLERMIGEQAVKKLLEGNERFVQHKALHPSQSPERRAEVMKGQRPFAVILGCSDSRVPPEILFDQGIGDLFVIRVAGNILNDHIIASMEYAVEHLGVSLIMVLGHQKCGAVEAAIRGGAAPPRILDLLKSIQPAIEEAKHQGGNLLENAIQANVNRIVQQLIQTRPILSEEVHREKILIIGARYDLESGKVTLLRK
jgi:carbonic anhydrase